MLVYQGHLVLTGYKSLFGERTGKYAGIGWDAISSLAYKLSAYGLSGAFREYDIDTP
jgi:hypothetical protein